jgi:hypothetical protein
MRLLLRPSEVLGAIVADDSLPTVAVRRLLLLGCTVELDGNGEDSIVCGPTTVSRPVVFKPCGAAPVRAASRPPTTPSWDGCRARPASGRRGSRSISP